MVAADEWPPIAARQGRAVPVGARRWLGQHALAAAPCTGATQLILLKLSVQPDRKLVRAGRDCWQIAGAFLLTLDWNIFVENLAGRVDSLERANRRLTAVVGVLLLVAGAAALSAARSVEPKLRASELEIVDSRGVVRARLAGDVPDPVIQGRLIRRDSRMSGLILYDQTGQERSGYVTEDRSSNVLLTLDSRHKQTALFVADTAGSTVLRIWRGDDEAELRTDSEGPSIRLARAGQLVFRQPEVTNPRSTSLCRELRAARQRAQDSVLQKVCRRHMPEGACRLCLSEKAHD